MPPPESRCPQVRVFHAASLAAACVCRGHTGSVTSVSLPFADTPSVLLTSSSDGHLRTFDARAPAAAPSATWAAPGRSALACSSASCDGFSLAAGSESGDVYLWDRRVSGAGGGSSLRGVVESAHADGVTAAAWHPRAPTVRDSRFHSCQ